MKTSLSLLFIALVCIAAFLMGRGNFGGPAHPVASEVNTRTTSSQSAAAPIANIKSVVKTRISTDVVTTATAGKMTPAERVALLKKAALLADTGKQSDILCGLISAMTQEELVESTQALLDAQMNGNSWSQEVWNSLWTQWGRVGAVACLELSQQSSGGKTWNGFKGLNTYNDYRCLMAGWLETHPEEAMAWAKLDKLDNGSAAGAAYAITSSAQGDLKQMETAILGIAGNKLTARACFEDYFDLAATSADKPSPALIYDRLPPALRSAAWPTVAERLSQGDPRAAATWLESHANDPGYEPRAAYGLIQRISGKNPEEAVQMAISLPASAGGMQPAVEMVRGWLEKDPAAANAWLKTQPANSAWVAPFFEKPEN